MEISRKGKFIHNYISLHWEKNTPQDFVVGEELNLVMLIGFTAFENICPPLATQFRFSP
jgi:hypothetical protein